MSLLSTVDPTYDDAGHRTPHRNIKPTRQVSLRMPDAAIWADIIRGRHDPVWAAERFLGVKLNRGQRKWIRAATLRAADGWRPAFLTTVVSAGNRAGKTLGLAIIIWHHCFYKLGLRPPNYDDPDDILRWAKAPYVWYHISYQQKIARHVWRELSLLFAGDHPAQFDRATGKRRGCPLLAELGPIVTWDKTYEHEYEYIAFHPLFGGAQIHFRNSDEHAKGLLGLDMNGISFDEAAFELYLDDIRHQVLNLRRLSTGGPMHFISTPDEGHNDFYDLWEEGNPANPNRDPKVISLAMSSRDNIGYGLTQENFDDIVRQTPEYLIPQNIDGQFIEAKGAYFSAPKVEECFIREMDESQAPKKGHRYVQGCDPGIAADAAWGITLDFTNPKALTGVRARSGDGKQAIQTVVNMVREGHLLYSSDGASCTTIIDSTAMGGKMFKQEFSIIKPLRDFDFGGTKSQKLQLLSDLRVVIDRGWLKMPRSGRFWGQLRRQLLGYKLDDKKLTQDAVMALALAVRHAVRHSEKPDPTVTYSYFG
jgi:hypothetical protein